MPAPPCSLLVAAVVAACASGCVVSSKACDPVCPIGFECDDGACRSRCQPACAPGFVCDLLGVCAQQAGTDLAFLPDLGPPDLTLLCTDRPPAAPLRIAASAPSGGLLSGDGCRALYQDGADVREVRVDGLADRLVASRTQPPSATLRSPDGFTAAVCGAQSCWLQRIGAPPGEGRTPLFEGARLAGGAYSADGARVLAFASTGTGVARALVGPSAGPMTEVWDTDEPPWIAATPDGALWTLRRAGAEASLVRITAVGSGQTVFDGVLGVPAQAVGGFFFAGPAIRDDSVGGLRFAPLDGRATRDLGPPAKATAGLFPSPDGVRVMSFRAAVGGVAQLDLTDNLGGSAALGARVLPHTPMFSTSSRRLSYARSCDAATGACSMTVLDVEKGALYPVGAGNASLPVVLSSAGRHVFLGDGQRLVEVDTGRVLRERPGRAYAAGRQGEHLWWIEEDQATAARAFVVFDTTRAMTYVDPRPAIAAAMRFATRGALVYAAREDGVELRAFDTARAEFVVLMGNLAGLDAPLDPSRDERAVLAPGDDRGLYLVALP